MSFAFPPSAVRRARVTLLRCANVRPAVAGACSRAPAPRPTTARRPFSPCAPVVRQARPPTSGTPEVVLVLVPPLLEVVVPPAPPVPVEVVVLPPVPPSCSATHRPVWHIPAAALGAVGLGRIGAGAGRGVADSDVMAGVDRGAGHRAPTQMPAWQASVCVQALPSSQVLPSALTGLSHMPVVGSQVPASWQASSAVQVKATPLLTQLPAAQWSPTVQALLSVHSEPSGVGGFVKTPVAGSQRPSSWHWSTAAQVTGLPPTQIPAWQASVWVQAPHRCMRCRRTWRRLGSRRRLRRCTCRPRGTGRARCRRPGSFRCTRRPGKRRSRCRVAVIAAGAVGLVGVGADARRRVARARDVALVKRAARHRVRAGAGAGLAGWSLKRRNLG